MTTATQEVVAARANTLLELGRAGEAVSALTSALAQYPDEPALLDLLARAQLKLDPHAAVETADRLIAAQPASHRGYLLAAIANIFLGRSRQARQHAERAVKLAPNNSLCHAQFAQSMAGQLRNYLRARRAAKTAIELAPNNPVAHVTAGNVALCIGRTSRARRHFRDALQIDPTNSVAQTNYALVRYEYGNTAKALKELSSALRSDPKNPQTRRVFDQVIYRAICDLLIVWFLVNFAVTLLRT